MYMATLKRCPRCHGGEIVSVPFDKVPGGWDVIFLLLGIILFFTTCFGGLVCFLIARLLQNNSATPHTKAVCSDCGHEWEVAW